MLFCGSFVGSASSTLGDEVFPRSSSSASSADSRVVDSVSLGDADWCSFAPLLGSIINACHSCCEKSSVAGSFESVVRNEELLDECGEEVEQTVGGESASSLDRLGEEEVCGKGMGVV